MAAAVLWLTTLVVVGLVAVLFILGLIRLGLVTFAGSAPPTIRYQSAQRDARSAGWSFDDLEPGQIRSDPSPAARA